MHLSPFLRTVLKLDAASCLAMAAVILPFASTLAEPLGLSAPFLSASAGSLVLVGLFILAVGLRTTAPAAMIALVIAGNLAWSAASMLVVVGSPTITGLGQVLVTIQAAAVIALAVLEWHGLRGSRDMSATRATA